MHVQVQFYTRFENDALTLTQQLLHYTEDSTNNLAGLRKIFFVVTT